MNYFTGYLNIYQSNNQLFQDHFLCAYITFAGRLYGLIEYQRNHDFCLENQRRFQEDVDSR